jgi:beta-galactosidase
VPDDPCPFLVALDQCGLELQGPHMLTTTKRLVAAGDVDPGALQSDSLRYHAWDPDAVRARYAGLDPSTSFEIEAVYCCERGVERSMALVGVGGIELHAATPLRPGGATTVRVPVPDGAIRDGVLELAAERRAGPDAVLSELRLYASAPAAPSLTVVGDSRGGLVGTVGDAAYAGVAGALVEVAWADGLIEATTDATGLFRVPLRRHMPPGRQAELTVTATVGALRTTTTVDTRHLALGLRELPPSGDRLDLAGEWTFLPGNVPDPADARWADAAGTRVPGHVAFDGLVPDLGVGSLRRIITIPEGWAGDAVFARFDGAYGRSEVYANGTLVGIHGAGATSFDVDLRDHLGAGDLVLTVVLTEMTPHAVLDYMSWYAHISLLGIWRPACLFRVAAVHLGPLDLAADWDPDRRLGALALGAEVVNVGAADNTYELEVSVLDGDRLVHRSTVAGFVPAGGGERREVAVDVDGVDPWSAEVPRLYDLDLVLRTGDGGSQVYRRRIGFRRVRVDGNRLLVNGSPIRLVGVNRHDARMRTGRAMSTDDLRHDVLALRQANVNVIRTAHYPADPRLLDLCDELGMYVQDQSPICFAAGFDDHHWTRTNDAANLVPYVLEVTAETVGRDLGHASVLAWDLANETQWAWGFDAQLALVRAMDPSRPTVFSFDLNQLGDENPLPQLPPARRPDLRTYHYPGWDRSWQEDIDWLRTYDQPVVLDECIPPFQDNTRAPLHAEMLTVDPGVRDYWVSGVIPFVERAMRDHGCIGGMIWSAVDDQFILPIDESVGSGAWAHLAKLDYFRVRDVHPPRDGIVFRGEGEWGLLDGSGRPRPELAHVRKLYSPIAIREASFDDGGRRLELAIANRFAHRSFGSLDVRVDGATLAPGSRLVAGPGGIDSILLDVSSDAGTVEVAFGHPEGWLVDAFRWAVPGRSPDVRDAVRAGAEALRVSADPSGRLRVEGTRPWLGAWPRIHLLDANHSLTPVPVPVALEDQASVAPDGRVTVPLAGEGWTGWLAACATSDGSEVVFEYACTYAGDAVIQVREAGLAFDPPADLADLWWRRTGDWSWYPEGHIGRERGYAASAPGVANPLRPAARWELDTTPAGTNDYRSSKRGILAGGATDGTLALSVLSDGSQHLRAAIVDGRPVLHVLDWYGGVPLTVDTDHIWSGYFGLGLRIERGTELRGRITLAGGGLPAGICE